MKLKVQDVLNVALFSALTEIGACICVPLPFSPVPITLQTLFTCLAGALLGGYLGALSQMIYVILRAALTGFQVVVGPTGGYLIGFIIGAFVIGKLVEVRRNPRFQWLLASMTAGTAVIYAAGVLQLINWMGIGIKEAFIIGVLPFIVGDMLKILVAAYITVRVRKIIRGSF